MCVCERKTDRQREQEKESSRKNGKECPERGEMQENTQTCCQVVGEGWGWEAT